MKRTLSFAACALFLALSAFSVDFGGSLSNYTRFKGKDFQSLKLDQVDDLSLWIKTPLDKKGDMSLAAEGLYEFEYDGAAKKAYNRLDISLLKFSGQWNLKPGLDLSVGAGRFIYSDFTGLIMSQNADGVYGELSFPRAKISAYAGYTGLLNANLVKMQSHANDPDEYDTEAVYDLAKKYVAASAGVTFPNLFSSHALSAQFLGAFRTGGTKYNRTYISAAASGPIWQTLYYSASTTLGFQKYEDGDLEVSNLTKAGANLYLPFKSLSFGAGVIYASGEQGPFKPFKGFTKIDALQASNEPQYTGIIKTYVSASMKPLQNLLCQAGAAIAAGAEDDSVKYKGFEWSLGADWQIVSDASVGASFVQYIDKDDSNAGKVQISLNASLSF